MSILHSNSDDPAAPPSIVALGHTVLLCRRFAATRRFYEATLGLPLAIDRPGWVSLSVGATLLSLRERGSLPFADDGPAAPEASAGVQLAFLVGLADIERYHGRLRTAGAPILRGPTDIASWRHRTLFVRDPEDNIIEIYAEI